MMGYPLLVRIEVESMKQAMVHAFSERQLQVDAEFQAALDAAIAGFDWRGEVERAAREALREAVGWSAKRVVEQALKDARWNKKLVNAAADAVAAALREQQGR